MIERKVKKVSAELKSIKRKFENDAVAPDHHWPNHAILGDEEKNFQLSFFLEKIFVLYGLSDIIFFIQSMRLATSWYKLFLENHSNRDQSPMNFFVFLRYFSFILGFF